MRTWPANSGRTKNSRELTRGRPRRGVTRYPDSVFWDTCSRAGGTQPPYAHRKGRVRGHDVWRLTRHRRRISRSAVEPVRYNERLDAYELNVTEDQLLNAPVLATGSDTGVIGRY